VRRRGFLGWLAAFPFLRLRPAPRPVPGWIEARSKVNPINPKYYGGQVIRFVASPEAGVFMMEESHDMKNWRRI
jgi:hypothetical protein